MTTYLPWSKSKRNPWEYCGSTKARYLEYPNMDKVCKVLKEFDKLYGNGYYPVIGDCVPNDPTITIPGHPAGSHRRNAMDMNYIVKSSPNYTQYMSGDGAKRVIIWNKDKTLKVSVFDGIRTGRFISMMIKTFPNAKVWVDERIFVHLLNVFFFGEYEGYLKRIEPDEPEHNNHHLHMHWKLRG